MKGAVIQSRGALFHFNLYRTSSIQSSVLAMVLRVAGAAPAKAATLHAWSAASAPAYHQTRDSGALRPQSVALPGAPPTA